MRARVGAFEMLSCSSKHLGTVWRIHHYHVVVVQEHVQQVDRLFRLFGKELRVQVVGLQRPGGKRRTSSSRRFTV